MNTSEISNEDQQMKSQMEKAVPTYDSYMRKITLGREQVLRETTLDLAQVKPGDCILEVGCGTGTLTLAAKRRVGPAGKAFGIDVIPGMIAASQRKAAQANQEITFQSGSIDDIPFSDHLFDVVMCSFMIFHMSENTRRKGFDEINRVLKPGGQLLVLDLALPTRPVPKTIARMLLGGVPPDLRELIPVMNASGFSDIEIGSVKFRILGLSVLSFVRGSTRKS